MPVPRPVFDQNETLAVIAKEQRISAADHFGEPLDLWEKNLPAAFRDRAPRYPKLVLYETNHHLRAGGWDAHERLKDLALDGTSATVLYPTLGHDAWRLDDLELQEACIRVYNDYVIEQCSVAPERLWGLAMIPLGRIDHAIQELERCKKAGLRGAEIPVGQPLDNSYSSERYGKFWAVAQSLDMPINLHINTGTDRIPQDKSGLLPYGVHKFDCMRVLGDLIVSGVMERYPDLKFVISECGSGWIPFFAQEFDYYMMGSSRQATLPRPPSEYLARQVYTVFIGDQVAGDLAEKYGKTNFMWSSDYPHPACTWPNSAASIAQDLGHVSEETRANIVCNTAAAVYNSGQLPPPADPAPTDYQPLDTWNYAVRTDYARVGVTA
ncbi:MAG: amidohydrolase [Chloroflexi bacterium]|nr:amidohydrolase [Chloroflexota bacterium]